MSKLYAIGVPQYDCEIHIELLDGDYSSIEYIKEDILESLKAFPNRESGYCEQYPFYMANWNVVGYDDNLDNFVEEISA